jgi:hypothetical protein
VIAAISHLTQLHGDAVDIDIEDLEVARRKRVVPVHAQRALVGLAGHGRR